MHYSSWGPIYFMLLPFEVVSEGCRMVFNRTYRRRPPPILHDPRWGRHKGRCTYDIWEVARISNLQGRAKGVKNPKKILQTSLVRDP